jgi:hypothetical protein
MKLLEEKVRGDLTLLKWKRLLIKSVILSGMERGFVVLHSINSPALHTSFDVWRTAGRKIPKEGQTFDSSTFVYGKCKLDCMYIVWTILECFCICFCLISNPLNLSKGRNTRDSDVCSNTVANRLSYCSLAYPCPKMGNRKPNIFDNMIAILEKHAYNLEAQVKERTEQLLSEKKKTEMLLLRMLPK